MIPFLLFLLLLPQVFARTSSSAILASSSNTPQSLEEKIRDYVAKKQPQARVALSVRSVRTDSVIHELNSQEWFTPASTMKALTVAAAMDTFPLDWTPSTELGLYGWKSGRAFHGVVRVRGGGDPNLSARFYPEALSVPLQMVDSIRASGIDTLVGWFEADESWFQGPRRPKVWRDYFFDTWYGAEISALSFNDNVYQLSVLPSEKVGEPVKVSLRPDLGYVKVINQAETSKGRKSKIKVTLDSVENQVVITGTLGIKANAFQSVYPVRRPAGYFLAALRQACFNRGVVFIPDSTQKPTELFAQYHFASIPVQSIYDEVNQRSQNFHAECLLRQLGALRLKNPSAEGGVMAGKLFLRKMKIPEESFVQVDGSGLSPQNKVKPADLSLLLSRMAKHPRGALYMNSFGQPGVTGSGARRLGELEMAHLIRFKTGFIAGAQGLVGYIGQATGDTMAVVVYLNGYRGADSDARNIIDSIWSWLAVSHNQEYASVLEARRLWNEGDSIVGIRERLDFFSKRLLERPYFLGPTGEGFGASIDPKPRMDLTRFDCVTYLEHVMALAYAKNSDGIFSELQNIRYTKGDIRFESRKHYFVEDWIGQGKPWVKLARFEGDTVVRREMDKKTFFANQKLEWKFPNPTTEIPNLPIGKAIPFSKNWQGPEKIMGVAFMTTLPNLCVFHTGFVIAHPGEPLRFRHASQLKGQTTEQDLSEYLESKKARIPGVVFFDFLPQQ